MIKSNIALIGMPGASKTTVGKLLAKETGMLFMDTDMFIEYEHSVTIADMIKLSGEDYFRRAEHALVVRICDMENVLVATGGGTVLDERNRALLKESAYIVWLKAKPLTIYRRIKGDSVKRPLLSPLKIEKVSVLLRKRMRIYKEMADIEIDTDGRTPEQITRRLMAMLEDYITNQE